ncbi:extracellular solute-binding protein [Nocardioides litoris]|uniref:extracellular solute-binding protein n=1 Tax=Nocardioides litoris TaxID=1926648 RepID=UPI0011207001|nr:extracellular solute-binding protein [Nocardioides litoris]
MSRRPRRRLVAVASAAALLAGALAACSGEAPAPGAPDPGADGRTSLTFGVFGPEPVVAAYQQMVDRYNETAESVRVDMLTWPSQAAMRQDVAEGAGPPDVYLVSRQDLGTVIEQELNVPLFELLEARDVSYGDRYAQPAIEAFSADDDLQCMPSTASPEVVFYNTDLVDFDRMRERGLPAPEEEPLDGWTFEEFAAAAAFASRRGDNRGVAVEPDLTQLAPFLLSGGGSLYDDGADPTSLALASSDNIDTLETVLRLLRDPTVTLSDEQLAEASPLEWFERGRLGMVVGTRELVPQLREVEGLSFDVMPMPQVGSAATVGDLTGLCIAPGDHEQQSADFLVHAISDESVAPLARSGYVVPSNVAVARSAAFLQPGEQPEHAGVFNASLDALRLVPIVEDPTGLDEAVGPLLEQMLTAPGVIDVEELAAEADEASRAVLDPDYTPSPSEDPSAS